MSRYLGRQARRWTLARKVPESWAGSQECRNAGMLLADGIGYTDILSGWANNTAFRIAARVPIPSCVLRIYVYIHTTLTSGARHPAPLHKQQSGSEKRPCFSGRHRFPRLPYNSSDINNPPSFPSTLFALATSPPSSSPPSSVSTRPHHSRHRDPAYSIDCIGQPSASDIVG